tara:strand:+ start:388 stop:615 length:228 start_codon:yes stop_codon:yes gene_type:complete
MATTKKKKTQNKATMIKNITKKAKHIKNQSRIASGLGISISGSADDYKKAGEKERKRLKTERKIASGGFNTRRRK